MPPPAQSCPSLWHSVKRRPIFQMPTKVPVGVIVQALTETSQFLVMAARLEGLNLGPCSLSYCLVSQMSAAVLVAWRRGHGRT